MPRRSAYDLAWRPILRATSGLAVCLALTGCLTTPLEQRDWVLIQTAHYDIWSSLDEDDSSRVAIDLERFRAAAEYVWDAVFPAEPVRTRVYAFDDRGIGRPFAYLFQRSYLLPRQRGDVIVLRAGDGWVGDARVPLKLDYTRRLISNATPAALPPWFEEGLAQVASTVEISGDRASIGIFRADHVRLLRERQWIPFRRLLAATDLRGWSSLERELFEAESWALCHYLEFDRKRRPGYRAALTRFRAALAEGIPAAEAARTAFGEEFELQGAVFDHVRAEQLPSYSVEIPWIGPSPKKRAASQQEILEELGLLALAIDEREQAGHFLELAQESDARSARALAGLADLSAVRGDRDAADSLSEEALAVAPDDPLLHLGRANLLSSRAAQTSEPAQRAELLLRAREHYEHSIALDANLPESHAGLAASYLLDGEDPAGGREPAIAARRLLPGEIAIRALGARLALARGDRDEARREALEVITRARTERDLEAGRSLLAQAGETAAIP